MAWSPWGQQWPGSACHFLLLSARLSPLLEAKAPLSPVFPSHPLSPPLILFFSVCVCVSQSVSHFLVLSPCFHLPGPALGSLN